MIRGGTIDTDNSEYLAQGAFELIQGSESLKEAAKKFLDQNENLKNSDLTKVGGVVSLLNGDKSKDFLDTISKGLSEEEKFKRMAEQTGKDQVVTEELEALGNQLLIQGVISGTAFTTLTGTLIGSLTIEGMAGALISGGAVLAELLAIAAVAAIAYAVYKHRGEIKEGVIEAGKAIKSFMKDVIGKLPVIHIRSRDKNFYKLYQELSQRALHAENEEMKNIQDKAKIIEML